MLTKPLPVRRSMLMYRVQDYVRRGPRQRLSLSDRLLVDPTVHGDHDDSRYPETDRAADQRVILVDDKHADVRVLDSELDMLVRRVPPQEYGGEADQCRPHPDVGEHKRDGAMRHRDRVLERSHDRVVPIHTDAAQMQDRGGRKVNVQTVPDVAHEMPEEPFATGQFYTSVERHRAQCH